MEKVIGQLPAASPMLSDRVDALQVLPALGEVDEVYQAAVALFYLEDYAYKDIAVILDVPVGTITSRITRGIAQLREILFSEGARAVTPLNQGTPNGALVPVSCGNRPALLDSQLSHGRV